MRIKPKTFLVLDTETASLHGDVYDIGWVICRKDGIPIVKREFAIRETLYDGHLMTKAFFAKKVFSSYIPRIERRDLPVVSWFEAVAQLRKDLYNYDINMLCAYNLAFDLKVIGQMQRKYDHGKRITPDKLDKLCLWLACCELRLNTSSYKQWAMEHGAISEAGNFRTTAEWAYRYMTLNPNFVESHTALHDAEIEAELLAWCLRRRKKLPKNKLGQACWRLLK